MLSPHLLQKRMGTIRVDRDNGILLAADRYLSVRTQGVSNAQDHCADVPFPGRRRLAATTAASAQENNCLAEVDRLASSLGMKGEASPQATVPRSGASSESLAQSGGVIQPPDVGSARVIEPPQGTADGMNTAPAMPQQDGAPQGTVPNTGTGQPR